MPGTQRNCGEVGAPSRLAGSFRDNAGQVYAHNGRIFRAVSEAAARHFDAFSKTSCFKSLVDRGLLLNAERIEPGPEFPSAYCWLEHPKLRTIAFPYEWPFQLLKDAALLHLTVQLEALEAGFVLSDASAYNVMFSRGKPVFIDILSFRQYAEGEYWLGHRQFCDQFLHPLLLSARYGIDYNAWYRGSLEGIPGEALYALHGWSDWLSPRYAAHVLLPARLQAGRKDSQVRKPSRPLPRAAYGRLLQSLHDWISTLQPRRISKTVWSDYEDENTYASGEAKAKIDAVQRFIREEPCALLVDMGCNSGAYSEAALKAGAQEVVGFDADRDALLKAARRRSERQLPFLPLYLDAANPSPSQGWRQQEREGFSSRFKADAVLVLAFIHHLAIGRNIPLPEAVDWLLAIAPRGLIEFVPKSDPTIGLMLKLREDIFTDYTEENFTRLLGERARISSVETVSESGRKLYTYTRSIG